MFLISLINYAQPTRLVLVPHTSALFCFFQALLGSEGVGLECQVPSGWVGPML